MAKVPAPNYDYQTNQLAGYYRIAIKDILAELDRVDISDFRRANALATLQSISGILSDLDTKSARWVSENVPIAANEGVINTLVSLKVAETVEQAALIVKFNELNEAMVAAAIADTQADLLAVTQNVDRKTKAAVRRAVSDSIKYNMTSGTNGRRTIRDDIKKRLKESVVTGIVDAKGRRWKPEVYADMVTRTKMMQTYREATTNEAVDRGVLYAQISSHGAKDACRGHEGEIIKLTLEAPGDFKTYEELQATGEIFHPRCKHVYSPIRDVGLLSER
ncbi:phage minor capsid protein [Bacillus pumilus]|uniref:Minor capsid protein n=1 Tax=Bacillus pumilus TaxID=1408 RepID=A0AAE4B7Q3_BACPU|nr:phage minor capsid protein [Bacillus pumilus]MDR4250716.1 minor capsid protein [Bacillus pumilus]